MRHVFWLIPGVLAGRPGPDRESWNLEVLKLAGIGAVLSVNEGLLCHPEDFASVGMPYRCLPLPPNAPPQSGDLEYCRRMLPKAFDFVEEMRKMGKATLVHCTSGKDRTGLLMAYYLVHRHGMTTNEAIAAVKRVRPIALSALGWSEFAQQVLSNNEATAGFG